MPAYSTHYIFAKELEKQIEASVDFRLDSRALIIGAQGPDIFFFHRILPWMCGKTLCKTASKLHRAKPEKIFEAMREYIGVSHKADIAKSYACGFFLHYALDRKCHPFVYAKQNEMVKKSPFMNPHTAHNTIEFAMDSYLLNKRMKIEKPYLFDTYSTISTDSAVNNEIGKMMSFVVAKTLGVDASPKSVVRAIEDTKYIQRASGGKSKIKKPILSVIEAALAPLTKNFKFTAFMRPKDLEKAKKYGNINHIEWQSPFSGEKSSESFEELFEKAKPEALDMLHSFFNGEPCDEITKNISFLTGVKVE